MCLSYFFFVLFYYTCNSFCRFLFGRLYNLSVIDKSLKLAGVQLSTLSRWVRTNIDPKMTKLATDDKRSL